MSDTTSFPFHPSIPRIGDPVKDTRPTESYLWHDAVAEHGETVTVSTYAYGLPADLDDFDVHRWDTPFEDRKVVVTGLTGKFVDVEFDPDLHRFWFDLTDDLDFPMGITAEDYEYDWEDMGEWSDRRRVAAAYIDAVRAVNAFYRNRPIDGDSPWLTADEFETYMEAIEVLRDGLGIDEDTTMTDDDLIAAAIEDYDTRDDCYGLLETIPEVEYSLVPALRDIARAAWARVQECGAR